MGFLDFLNPIKQVASVVGGAAKFIGERILPPKKMSESEKADKYATIFAISEGSTDSARKMFMTEMQTQKQPWLIRVLNGFVRPFGGIGSLSTEFYAIWGQNLSAWFGFKYFPVMITKEQHFVLLLIIGFYFGSRLKETLTGNATTR